MSFKKAPRPTAWERRTTEQRKADAQRVFDVRVQRGATVKEALAAARELHRGFPRPPYDTTPGRKEQEKKARRAAEAQAAQTTAAETTDGATS